MIWYFAVPVYYAPHSPLSFEPLEWVVILQRVAPFELHRLGFPVVVLNAPFELREGMQGEQHPEVKLGAPFDLPGLVVLALFEHPYWMLPVVDWGVAPSLGCFLWSVLLLWFAFLPFSFPSMMGGPAPGV